MNFVRLNNPSLKYKRFAPPGCTDIGIIKFEFVEKTRFLGHFSENRNQNCHFFRKLQSKLSLFQKTAIKIVTFQKTAVNKIVNFLEICTQNCQILGRKKHRQFKYFCSKVQRYGCELKM